MKCTVQDHAEFLAGLLSEDDFDDLVVDPFNGDPPSRRKDSEVDRVNALLDSIAAERGNG
jgi:hypothetical protein